MRLVCVHDSDDDAVPSVKSTHDRLNGDCGSYLSLATTDTREIRRRTARTRVLNGPCHQMSTDESLSGLTATAAAASGLRL
eukprot:1769547-Rhodomonas_salina.2